ncbi:MAG: DUF6650 family protein [Actinomycetota bacterium]
MASRRPRLTGASGFGFGASWEWVETDAEIVRDLIIFLEDRRALAYDQRNPEDVEHVTESVLRTREELTKALQRLANDSGANHAVRAMRDACRQFLDMTRGTPQWGAMNRDFLIALGQLRQACGMQVRELADRYQIEVHPPLARVLLALDEAEDAGTLGAYLQG